MSPEVTFVTSLHIYIYLNHKCERLNFISWKKLTAVGVGGRVFWWLEVFMSTEFLVDQTTEAKAHESRVNRGSYVITQRNRGYRQND